MAYTNFQNCTANEYKNIIYNQETNNKIKVLFNNVELEDADEYCESFEVVSRVIPNGSKIFMLENLVSQEATLVLHNIDTSIIQDQVSISIGTLVSENTYEYVPIGTYNLQEIPTTDNGKTTIKLRDNSVKLDFNYNAKPLIDEHGGTATKLQILQDICTKAGITCNVSSFIGSSDLIGIYDNTITGRQYVAYLAGSAGAIPIITRSGALDFKYLNNLSTIEIPIEIVEQYSNAENFKISRVVYEDAIRKYESGNENYDTLFLDSANPYISSQEQVSSIYNIVNNFEINSFTTGRILGNPAIDSYDLIQITDYDGTIFKTFANNTLRYNGKMINTFASEISFERKKENVSLKSGATFKKWAKTEIDNANAQITIQAGQIEEIEQDIQNPTSTKENKYFDLEDALDSPLIDFSLYGNTSQSGTPTPSSPQEIHNVSGDNEIKVCGKNLWSSEWEQGQVDSSGNNASATDRIRTKGYISVIPLQHYAIKRSIGTRFITVRCYDKNKNYLGAGDVGLNLIQGSTATNPMTNGDTTCVIQPKEGVYYLRFNDITNDLSTNYMMVKGDTPQDYEAYQGNSQLISLGDIELNKINTYQDYIYKDNDKWYLHKEIGKVVLDGSENWGRDGLYNDITQFALDLKNVLWQNDGVNRTLSNRFKGVPYRNSWKIDGSATSSYSNKIRLMTSLYTSVTDFKTWLSTHNTIVYYVLATATDTEITDTRLLEQLNRLMTLPLYKNMTHITLTPNDLQPTMKIEYYRDTSINENFVRQPQLENYYTKSETTAQINISNSSIKSDVAEIQTTLDENGNAINIISNQVQNLQTSTSKQINIINEQLENGVEKVKTTTGYTFDNQGLGITKGEEFKNLITDRNQQISSNNKEIMFMGYDDDLKKTVARIPELESRQATIGLHRTEIIYEDNMYWTAEFYVGGGN